MNTTISPELLTGALKIARAGSMADANEHLEGYGVEHVRNDLTGESLSYVNLGDTYTTTICKDKHRTWIGSWGAWYESQDARAARSGLFRCGHCGTCNQRARRARHNFTCESCNNPVLGN